MRKENLSETWFQQGTDIETLEKIIEDVTKSTKMIEITAEDMKFFGKQADLSGEDVLVEANATVFDSDCDLLSSEVLNKQLPHCDENVFSETMANGMVFRNKAGVYYSCFNGVRSDLAFLGITGECTELDETYPLMRMLYLLIQKKGKVRLVYREADDDKKLVRAITVRSKQYMFIPQTEAYQLVKETFCDGTMESWTVSNQLTSVNYSFKDQTVKKMYGGKMYEIYPYIHFRTSDAGESGLSVELGFDIGGRRSFLPEAMAYRKHKGAWNDKTRKEYASEVNRLRDKFTALADKLDELEKVQVEFTEIKEIISNLISDNKKFTKLVNKDVRNAIIAEAENVFVYPVHTAAEIMLYLMDIPDRLTNLTPNTIHQVREACGEFPFIKIRGTKGLSAKKSA